MADTKPQTYEPVTDGDADIAETMDGEKMRVQAPGRRPMQRVYLWEGNKDGTSKKKGKSSEFANKVYNPEEDGPRVADQGGSLPTLEGLQPGQSAVQYLEVGLVIGDNPAMYKPTANDGKKYLREARQRRGEMPRDESAIRAFIPITENIPLQSRYCVGVKFAGGRLHPSTIDGEIIFFYPEFWQGVPAGASKQQRRIFVNHQTKHLAADNKTQAERATASITVGDIQKCTASNPVTSPKNITNGTVRQYTLYRATGDPSNLRNMLEAVQPARQLGEMLDRVVGPGSDPALLNDPAVEVDLHARVKAFVASIDPDDPFLKVDFESVGKGGDAQQQQQLTSSGKSKSKRLADDEGKQQQTTSSGKGKGKQVAGTLQESVPTAAAPGDAGPRKKARIHARLSQSSAEEEAREDPEGMSGVQLDAGGDVDDDEDDVLMGFDYSGSESGFE